MGRLLNVPAEGRRNDTAVRAGCALAERIGLEHVPLLYDGALEASQAADFVLGLLERQSILGGPKIEGVVIKNYADIGRDGKVVMGKFVSAVFKEVHNKDWKDRNPEKGDVLDQICTALTTKARWSKAVQHLREAGTLANEPKDIGPLIKEVARDTLEEETEFIKDRLFAWAKKDIVRRVTAGLPEWYKEQLLESLSEEAE